MPSQLRPSRALPFHRFALLAVLVAGCGPRQPLVPVDRSQDARIQAEIVARLAGEPSIDAGNIRVVVEGGMAMLHGAVRGIGAWQCTITNAELVRGVQSVVDYLVIERGERDVRCLAPRPTSSVIVGEP
jgi:hypothetical protein